jgi:hypothetical protein
MFDKRLAFRDQNRFSFLRLEQEQEHEHEKE